MTDVHVPAKEREDKPDSEPPARAVVPRPPSSPRPERQRPAAQPAADLSGLASRPSRAASSEMPAPAPAPPSKNGDKDAAPRPVADGGRIRPFDAAVAAGPQRSDHEQLLDGMVGNAGALVDEHRGKILKSLRKSLSVGGTNVFRSDEVRQFRQRMKDAAREQASQDIDRALSPGGAQGQQLGEATKYYTEIGAKNQAYGLAKTSVDAELSDEAERWLRAHWDRAQIVGDVQEKAKRAAWALLQAGPGAERNIKAARTAAKETVESEAKRTADSIKAQGRAWKNSFIKPADASQQPVQVGTLAGQVKARTTADDVGGRAIETTIKANTTDEGLGVIGKMLDQVVPMAGDQVALVIELKIPIPDSPAYVSLKLEGKAARGITGAMTSGIPTMGDPHHLEVMAKFSVGVGAEVFGLKGDLSVGFFVRGGADGTAAAMKAVSYGAYRAACGINSSFGDWWGGGGKGTDRTARERAEAWAAMVEEQIFGDGANDRHASADIGASLGASGALNAADVFELGLAGGVEAFRRYDKDALRASLGPRLAKPARNAADAKSRRETAAGRTVGSIAVSGYTKVKILGQGVGFSGSFSGEFGDGTELRDNWGVEVTATLGFSPDSMNAVEKIAVGIVGGSLSAVQSLAAAIAKQKAVPMGDLAADAVFIENAAFQNAITDALAKAWSVDGSKFATGLGKTAADMKPTPGIASEGGLTVAVLFGKAGGKAVLRFEIRQAKKTTVNVAIGNVGLSVAVERSKRLAAVGYEDGKVNAEGLGFRARGPDHH